MSVQAASTFGRRLRALRLALEMSQIELARRIGRHQTAIGPYERDEYEPPRDVVEKLAAVLDTSPEYLYFGRSPQRATLHVAGRLGAAGMLEPQAEGAVETLSLRDQQWRGYRIEDDSMAPVFRPRQIVLTLATADAEPALALGRDALVELADGRTLLRRLLPSVDPQRLDLAAYNAPLLPAIAVKAVRSIVGVLWPEALRASSGEQNPDSVSLTVDEKF